MATILSANCSRFDATAVRTLERIEVVIGRAGPFNADHDIVSATASYELLDGISVDGVVEYSRYRSHDAVGPDYHGLAAGVGTLISF